MRLATVLCVVFIFLGGQANAQGNPVVRPQGVIASSTHQEHPVNNLIDLSWKSWSPRRAGAATFTFVLWQKTTIAGFALKNGIGNFDLHNQYGRVKTLNVYADGELIETIEIKDSMSFEQYSFQQPVNCITIRFLIDDIYLGTLGRTAGAHISEIALLNRAVSDTEFYENIISWLGIEVLHDTQITSVSDADKILLREYMPFEFPHPNGTWKTKIALLDEQSTLKLQDNLPRLDGATAMYPLYSAFVHAVYPERIPADNPREEVFLSLLRWEYLPHISVWDINWNRRNNMEGYIRQFASIVQCNTTSTAYQRLINGETDIVFCYEPSQAEIDTAAERGLIFNLTPIAKDAFVFIVNERNPLNNITLQQVRDIYSGRVTNWRDINGVNEPIIPYQRAENSGSQSTLQSIMRDDTLMRPILGGEYVPIGMGGMIRSIVSDFYNYNAAIGYTFLFYLNNMAGSAGAKALSIDGVTPNPQNIRNGSYPFAQTVYAITTGNESENTRRFIEWILSAQGQELVRRTGYTPVR